MAYYRFPFDHDFINEHIQKTGEVCINHENCAMTVNVTSLSHEITQTTFTCNFLAPTQLDSANQTERDEVTLMLNMEGAVQYHIEGFAEPKLVMRDMIGLCYTPLSSGSCRYQRQPNQLVVLHIPRQFMLDYLDIMSLCPDLQLQLRQRKPFLLLKAATPSLILMAKRLISRDPSQQTVLHGHLAHTFISDATRHLVEPNERSTRLDPCCHLDKAVQILDHDFASPPTITQLAHQIGTNEYSLKQWFRTELNTTVHQYILQNRMERAFEILENKQMQVSYVAQEVGYANHGHFAAAFKKAFGVSPSSFTKLSHQCI